MKGTFFQKPLEHQLRVDGEIWRQGDSIVGELTSLNRGSSPIAAQEIGVHLAVGELKKVRAKSKDAFQVLSSVQMSAQELAPDLSAQLSWRFKTEVNVQITDPAASLFLLYGKGIETSAWGQLQLVFGPCSIIEELFQLLEIDFRFVRKSVKSTQGRVEAKFAPPSAKSFATLEQLLLSARFEGEQLQLKYLFQVKKIEAAPTSFEVKKSKMGFSREYAPKDYLLPNGRIHHDRMEAELRQVLNQVESKILF